MVDRSEQPAVGTDFKLVLFISIISVSVSVCVEIYMCLLACLCLPRSLLCVRAFLQEVNPYSTVTSDPNELDRRYCVLKLHVPYSDPVHSPYTNKVGGTVALPHDMLIHHPCSYLAAASLFICFLFKYY